MNNKGTEFWVGLLMIFAAAALVFLALRVSGLSISKDILTDQSYQVTADFTDVGNLKLRSPVRIAGVEVGRVTNINLDDQTYDAVVTLQLDNTVSSLPSDTSASITSLGLLGDNYVSLTPGFDQTTLKEHGHIETTYAATSLHSLISTFMGNQSDDKKTLPEQP